MDKKYESHSYQNKSLPIIFHVDRKKGEDFTLMHWHEHIEILFFEQGRGEVFIDERILTAQKGDIVVINSEEIHSTRKTDEDILIFIKKHYEIDNPKSIAKFVKSDRNKILAELKKEISVRHLQRITGISRGVITNA